MAEYINPALEIDSSEIEDDVYTYVQTFYPDFAPREGHLATVLTEAFSQAVSDNRSLASDVPPEISRYFGPLFGVNPTVAAPATGIVTVTMIDNTGYDFDPGDLLFRMRITGEQYAGFENADPIHIAPGSTAATGVTIAATVDGTDGNGLSGTVELLTVEDKILSVTLTGGNTANGQDEQDIDSYLDQFAERMRLLADHVIKPEDVENYIKSLFPLTDRVLVLDGYNPGTATFDNEKTLTFVPIDVAGAALTSQHAAMLAALAITREWNFEFYAIDPTYNSLTIDVTVRAHAGWDTVALGDAVEAAIAAEISPAKHGLPQSGEERRWVLDGNDMVRFPDIMQVIKNTEGVNYIVDDIVTINGVDNTSFALTGVAPLPDDSPTINVTVQPAP